MGLSCGNAIAPCAQVLAVGYLDPTNQTSSPLDKVYMYSNVIRDSGEPVNGVGIGINTLTNNHSIYIYNNLLYNNPLSEIYLYAYSKIVPYPYNNRLVEIVNNTLWHNSSTGSASLYNNKSIYVPYEPPSNLWNGDEVIVKNNILANTYAEGSIFAKNGGVHNVANDYNFYYYPNGSLGTTAGLHDYASGASTNPLLVNLPSGPYAWGMGNLQSTSLAIGAGLNLSALFTTDFDLVPRPQSSSWDIGANEFILNLPGDVSLNGIVTMCDAALAYRDLTVGGTCSTLSQQQCINAEIDGRGNGTTIDSADVVDIAKRAVGLH